MSTTTSNYGLFKYDTTVDAQAAFNINNALNNNWDLLDQNAVRRLSSSAATGSATQPVYVDSSGQIQACDAYSTISSGLTATTSLAENGYIKFSSCVTFGQDITRHKPFLTSNRYRNNIKRIYSQRKGELLSA